ncbi:glycosyl transferase [Bradyrhizobium jicamae]|uniref:Glycosyl transferase n=2 Tax=Bradyrhizobium jicamae TaxID=280332 RepID=A0A0R3LHT4_9BRAD|nr:glycosyl transferase [Bradyrhizobium jicamae]
MASISQRVAQETDVLVLSGTAGSAISAQTGKPKVVEVRSWMPAKGALGKRAVAELLFTVRIFFALLARLKRGDVTLTVPAPFMLPYAFAAAAKLKGAKSVLIMHDLYPDVLVMVGLLKPQSMLARAMHALNAPMFRALGAVVIIGRDTEKLLLRYRGMTRDRIRFIPNWATLAPGVRAIAPDNPYRRSFSGRFVVGLSGNLGFTHDPVIVFEAARLLRDDKDIHFLLSGWGVGFDQLKTMQAEAKLPNVTLVERVEDDQLEIFLSAADVWIIPYRKNVAGVSVPSRFYNLLAIGRPVILVSEADAEAALTVTEHDVGWVVEPGNADELAKTVSHAARSVDAQRAERAAEISRRFDFEIAMAEYCGLIRELAQKKSS